MIQVFTLYRDADPESDPHAEYYSLVLFTKETFQPLPIYIRELHGWWSKQKGRSIDPVSTFNPDEGFDHPKDAEREFERHLKHRAREGYIHCFTKPSPFEPVTHRIIEVD
jgi:hypothetical protein